MDKIIQLLQTEISGDWEGRILGLGSDGVTYEINLKGRWEAIVPPLNYQESEDKE
jgi:hypothetical protein